MKDNVIRIAVCPLCGRTYHGVPALSREDNKTLICPDCGTRQALQSIGVEPSEQEQIIETIHRHTQELYTQFVPPIFVQIMLRIDLIICGFRANMYTPKGKTKQNGGRQHESLQRL